MAEVDRPERCPNCRSRKTALIAGDTRKCLNCGESWRAGDHFIDPPTQLDEADMVILQGISDRHHVPLQYVVKAVQDVLGWAIREDSIKQGVAEAHAGLVAPADFGDLES